MPNGDKAAASGASGSNANPLCAELTFDEMLRARQVFVLHTDEYIQSPFELRTILSELGQYPPDNELNFCVEAFNNKLSFNNFTSYLAFLKRRFMKPEPQDVDTLRAFVALGGGADRRGDINAENLRNACRHFDLTIDIDAMIREVDDDNSGKLEFNEFKSMWAAANRDGTSGDAAAAQHAALALEDPALDGALDVDEAALGGTLRSTAAAAVAKASVGKPTSDDDAPEPEEDTIELLKQHLFPNNTKKPSDTQKKAAAKRSSLVAQTRIPVAPLRDSALSSTGTSAAPANGGGATGDGKGNTAKDAVSETDSDDGDAPQSAYRNQYKPPSPVVLSMRNVKPLTKLRSGGSTPRGGLSARGGTTSKPSPVKSSPRSGTLVSPRR